MIEKALHGLTLNINVLNSQIFFSIYLHKDVSKFIQDGSLAIIVNLSVGLLSGAA